MKHSIIAVCVQFLHILKLCTSHIKFHEIKTQNNQIQLFWSGSKVIQAKARGAFLMSPNSSIIWENRHLLLQAQFQFVCFFFLEFFFFFFSFLTIDISDQLYWTYSHYIHNIQFVFMVYLRNIMQSCLHIIWI